MDKIIMARIGELSYELRLPAFRQKIAEVLALAQKEKQTPEQIIVNLLEKEYFMRTANRKKAQLRAAGFPQQKYLQDLVRSELPEDGQLKLPYLETLDFIKAGQNVILGGSPGTGKTHIAIGLGIAACLQGYSVLFTTIS